MIKNDFNTILELLQAFPDEQACIDHLESLRWPDGEVVSPFETSSKVYKCAGNKYRCKVSGKYFNVKSSALFDNTKIKLQKWFLAIWLVTSHKKGISSVQLSKDIGVTQKSAWFMLQRIRNCFGFDSNNEISNEVDETYIGSKSKNKHINKRTGGTQDSSTKGKVHTNTIERFWGLLKRGILRFITSLALSICSSMLMNLFSDTIQEIAKKVSGLTYFFLIQKNA